MKFAITIDAPKEKVWQTLWDDTTLRQWAGLIDPGTYMVGELVQGSEVQYISAENGYGVSSLVEKVLPGEYLLLRHKADTKNSGQQNREDQWAGGKESYLLSENGDVTTLTILCDIPPELTDIMNNSYPKALNKLKELAEA